MRCNIRIVQAYSVSSRDARIDTLRHRRLGHDKRDPRRDAWYRRAKQHRIQRPTPCWKWYKPQDGQDDGLLCSNHELHCKTRVNEVKLYSIYMSFTLYIHIRLTLPSVSSCFSDHSLTVDVQCCKTNDQLYLVPLALHGYTLKSYRAKHVLQPNTFRVPQVAAKAVTATSGAYAGVRHTPWRTRYDTYQSISVL